MSGVPLVALAMMACGLFANARVAGAEPRFGDSTWVAPAVDASGDPSADGPRIARPDHERGWETLLRTPFRIGFLPLRLAARGAEFGVGRYGDRILNPEPARAAKGLAVAPAGDFGSVTEFGVGPTITWSGFPSGASSLRLRTLWFTTDRRRAQLSERMGERRAIGFRLTGDYDYRPDLPFFGIGDETRAANRSVFLLESKTVEAALLFGASPLRQLRLLGDYSSLSPRRGYNDRPVIEDVFPPGSLPFQHERTEDLLYGATGDIAALDDGRDPTTGVHGRGEFRRATGLRDRDPDFYQWLLEGRAYAPVFARRRVIALRGVYAGVTPTGTTSTMPFYRLVQSDGPLRFAGYPSHRFQDRQLLLGRIEYRWEVWHRVRALALYELGEVAPRAGAFTARASRRSYGGGLRYGLSDEAACRLELAKSVEGFEATLTMRSGF
jgi:hypothetical protein